MNQLLLSDNRKELWNEFNPSARRLTITSLFLCENKKGDHTQLAKELLQFMINDDILEKRNIHANYVNLLCITLAQSHNSKYIKDIIQAKRCGDLFYYVDSNLLFEFSSNGNRKTCVKDTVKFVNESTNEEEWFSIYRDWINHYASHYDESIVTKYWDKYKNPDFIAIIERDNS